MHTHVFQPMGYVSGPDSAGQRTTKTNTLTTMVRSVAISCVVCSAKCHLHFPLSSNGFSHFGSEPLGNLSPQHGQTPDLRQEHSVRYQV